MCGLGTYHNLIVIYYFKIVIYLFMGQTHRAKEKAFSLSLWIIRRIGTTLQCIYIYRSMY